MELISREDLLERMKRKNVQAGEVNTPKRGRYMQYLSDLETIKETPPVFGRPGGYITTNEYARKYKVNIHTVRQWCYRGMLENFKIGGVRYIKDTEMPKYKYNKPLPLESEEV